MKKPSILLIIAFLGFLLGTIIAGTGEPWSNQDSKQKQAKTELLNQGIINILLIGVDSRTGNINSLGDTLILASIDTEKHKVALISIPRDTRVKEGSSYKKINAFNVEGGPELTREKVEELLQVPVHYYALTNFTGFKGMVDILGGVTLDVEKRMYKPSEGINLKPGIQRLDGAQALAYCRFRDDALGDIGRTERQQKFIKALAQEAIKADKLAKLPQLVPEMIKYINTDIPVSKMYRLARILGQFKKGELVVQTIPGTFYTDPVNGTSYWLADETQLPEIVGKVRSGMTVAVVEQKAVKQVAFKESTRVNTEEIPTSVDEPVNQVEPVQQSNTTDQVSEGETNDITMEDPVTADSVTLPDPNGEWVISPQETETSL